MTDISRFDLLCARIRGSVEYFQRFGYTVTADDMLEVRAQMVAENVTAQKCVGELPDLRLFTNIEILAAFPFVSAQLCPAGAEDEPEETASPESVAAPPPAFERLHADIMDWVLATDLTERPVGLDGIEVAAEAYLSERPRMLSYRANLTGNSRVVQSAMAELFGETFGLWAHGHLPLSRFTDTEKVALTGGFREIALHGRIEVANPAVQSRLVRVGLTRLSLPITDDVLHDMLSEPSDEEELVAKFMSKVFDPALRTVPNQFLSDWVIY